MSIKKQYFLFFILVCVQLSGCVSKNIKETEYDKFINDKTFQESLNRKKIKIIAPASGINSNDLIKIKKLPYSNLVNDVILNFPLQEEVPYNSKQDEERLRDLQDSINDDRYNVLWALRGGYGSSRLMEWMKTFKPNGKKKIIVGYSDITVLHLLAHKWGWPSIHGAVFLELTNSNKDSQNFYVLDKILSGELDILKYDNKLIPLNVSAKASAEINGKLIGGNMTLIQNSIGTYWQLNAKGEILFLEDLGEKGYAIDRSLVHLKDAGVFNNVKAIIFGEFAKSDDYKMYALQRFADNSSIPVFYAPYFGHGDTNLPLVFGCSTKISKVKDEKNKNYSLIIKIEDIFKDTGDL